MENQYLDQVQNTPTCFYLDKDKLGESFLWNDIEKIKVDGITIIKSNESEIPTKGKIIKLDGKWIQYNPQTISSYLGR